MNDMRLFKAYLNQYYDEPPQTTEPNPGPPPSIDEEFSSALDLGNSAFSASPLNVITGAANGCGSPLDPISYALVPNNPFESACNAHDACFAAGVGFTYV